MAASALATAATVERREGNVEGTVEGNVGPIRRFLVGFTDTIVKARYTTWTLPASLPAKPAAIWP
jgi:hypothetical protein